MDGNCTIDEEEEEIEAFQKDMPEMEKNVGLSFE